MWRCLSLWAFVLAFCQFPLTLCRAADTSLLFVGEDLSVLTIASRRAESPERAPAVAQVITREELEMHGVRSLGEALSLLPDFYVAPREWGSQPYLRGVSDSILFLYDSVPLTSDSTKSIHPLDEELSLSAIERIEVIRGPGSVLWGPDAFAGIVNVVPRRGRDLEGAELNARRGAPNDEEAFAVSWGRNTGLWEAFVSVSGTRLQPEPDRFNVVDFLGEDGRVRPFEERLGHGSLDESQYAEAVFNLSWQDWLHLSGRWSDVKRRYALSNLDGDLAWAAEREAPFRFLRGEAAWALDRSSLRINAYYNELSFEEQQVDLAWVDQKSHVFHGELLFDREVFATRGLMTLGASYRHNRITSAPIQTGFLPDFLGEDNPNFTPLNEQDDFKTELISGFAQYRHHWNRVDGWLGLRYDDHSQYSQTLSYNVGLAWNPLSTWHLKFLYGTAYRTPYNQQLVQEEGLDPEEVQSLSAELAWKPRPAWRFTVVPFWNQIRHHIQEDPRGGLSRPGRESLGGIEGTLNWQPSAAFRLWANGTFLSHTGDDESYEVVAGEFVLPDGTVGRESRDTWDVPFDTGPKALFNLGMSWRPSSRWDFGLRLHYVGTRKFSYLLGEFDPSADFRSDRIPRLALRDEAKPTWLLDVTATAHDVLWSGVDLQLAVKNALDRDYRTPGTYSRVDGAPLSVYISLRFRY